MVRFRIIFNVLYITLFLLLLPSLSNYQKLMAECFPYKDFLCKGVGRQDIVSERDFFSFMYNLIKISFLVVVLVKVGGGIVSLSTSHLSVTLGKNYQHPKQFCFCLLGFTAWELFTKLYLLLISCLQSSPQPVCWSCQHKRTSLSLPYFRDNLQTFN